MAQTSPVYDPDEEQKKHLSAEERAAQRWGMAPPDPSEPDDEESEPAEDGTTARDKANKRWGMSSDEIKDAEENPTIENESATSAINEETSLFNPSSDKPIKHRIRGSLKGLSNRKKLIGGGIIGSVIGLAIFLSSLVSGPLQFIHIAQLLQRFHFASVQDDSNSRILKLYKWTKNAKSGTIENTRLGIIGRRVATKIDTRLAEVGIEKQFSQLGNYEGTALDPVKFSENSENGAGYKRLNEQDFINKFQEDYGVRLQFDEELGKFKVNEDGFFSAYFKNRALNKMLVKEAGYDNISASVAARIMGKRDKVPWHPIERIDSKITGTIDQKFTAWLKKVKDRISNGDTESLKSSGSKSKDKSGNDTKESKDSTSAADSTNELTDDAKKAIAQNEDDIAKGAASSTDEVGNGIIKGFTESTAGKLGLSSTAVIGLACAAQGIAKAADGLKHDFVVLPLIRTGMQAISLGNQVMSGQDLDISQLGYFSKQLNDPKTGSWASARSIQAELGKEPTGPDIPDSASISKIQQGNMFSQILDSVPGLSGVCSVVNSSLGGLAMTIIGAVTAPVATIGQELVSQSGVLEGPINSLVRWIAGSPIPSYVTGSTYGNYINYGARLAANDQFASMGGAKLTSAESAELKNYNYIAQQQDVRSQTFAQRIFDPFSSDSLVGKAIDNMSPDASSNVATFFKSLANPMKVLSVLKVPFSQKTSAATASSYDYGFPEVGFSLSDMENPTYDNPYSNADNAIRILRSSNTYRDRIEKCFGVKFKDGGDGSLDTDFKSIDVLNKDYNGNNCSDPGGEWTSIRFYVFDMKTMESADCFETGDSQSCQNSGFGSSGGTGSQAASVASSQIVGNPYESSVNVECAPGTKDLGKDFDGYADGNLVKMRLCALPNLPSSGEESTPGDKFYVNGADGKGIVNSRVSGAWFKLINDARAEGIILTAGSTFRTMVHQQDLFNKAGHDTNSTASPGNSSHQAGVAIDFSSIGVGHAKSGATCDINSRQTKFGNPSWEWMYRHASNYGFKQYSAESWHWDALPAANRCGGPEISQTNPTTGPVRRF